MKPTPRGSGELFNLIVDFNTHFVLFCVFLTGFHFYFIFKKHTYVIIAFEIYFSSSKCSFMYRYKM